MTASRTHARSLLCYPGTPTSVSGTQGNTDTAMAAILRPGSRLRLGRKRRQLLAHREAA